MKLCSLEPWLLLQGQPVLALPPCTRGHHSKEPRWQRGHSGLPGTPKAQQLPGNAPDPSSLTKGKGVPTCHWPFVTCVAQALQGWLWQLRMCWVPQGNEAGKGRGKQQQQSGGQQLPCGQLTQREFWRLWCSKQKVSGVLMSPATGEALQPDTAMGPGKPGTGCVGLSPGKGKS